MGNQLVKFPLTAGGSILVEVDDPQIGNRQVSRDMAVRSVDNFDSVVAQVKPGVEILIAQLRDLTSRPDQVSLEFGIKLTAGGDALIAKTSLEGNIKVTLTWKSGAGTKSPSA